MEKSWEKRAKACFWRMTGREKKNVDKGVDSVDRRWTDWKGPEVWIRKAVREAVKGKVVDVETKLSTGL